YRPFPSRTALPWHMYGTKRSPVRSRSAPLKVAGFTKRTSPGWTCARLAELTQCHPRFRSSRRRQESQTLVGPTGELLNRCCQRLGPHRLGKMHLKACGQRVRPVFFACVRRQRRCRHLSTAHPAKFSHLAEQTVAVFSWHRNVAEQDLGSEFFDELHRFGCRRGALDFSTVLLERVRERLPPISIIFDDHHPNAIELKRATIGLSPRCRKRGF